MYFITRHPYTSHFFHSFPLRSTRTRWRSSRWSKETQVDTGVKCLLKTNVTAAPLRSLWRVSVSFTTKITLKHHLSRMTLLYLSLFLFCSCWTRGASRYFVCLQKSVSLSRQRDRQTWAKIHFSHKYAATYLGFNRTKYNNWAIEPTIKKHIG